MADVYLADQRSLKRQVAFKVLQHQFVGDERYVRRFHHEAQAAAALVHANIVQTHEVGCVDGVHFIAQEYVAGGNLRQWLGRNGPCDPKTAVNIMRQVAAALHKASQHGIVHRDIKPENIMLAKTGEVKVTDFGLARVVVGGETQNLGLTQDGSTMGTPLYMSPEQIEGRDLDPRSDIYSFGVTCYQMLAGRAPFEAETALGVAAQHLKSEPRRLEELRPDLPAELCTLVHKMLAKSPEHRQRSAAQVLQELRSLPMEGIEDSWPSGMEDWGSAPFPRDERRQAATQQLGHLMQTEAAQAVGKRRWACAFLGAGVCLLLGGLLAYLRREPPLLAVNPAEIPTIERKENAKEQYWHALFEPSEQAWLAVEEFFPMNNSPENDLYVCRAKRQLAALYRDRSREEDALRLYRELADEADDIELRALGLAGQASLESRLGDKTQVDQTLARLLKLEPALRERKRQFLDEVLNELDPKIRPGFERSLRELRDRDKR